MIDVTILRNSPDLIAESLLRRGLKVDLAALGDLDVRRRGVRADAESMRNKQKELGGIDP